jgi:hypothetical protein
VAKFEVTLQSSMAAEDAFAHLAAFERAAEWDPGVAEGQRLTAGPAGIGTRFRIVARFLGRTVPLEYRITRFDPPALVELSAESRTVRSVDEITFAPLATGSQVTYRADLRVRGALGRVAEPLLGLAFDRIGRRAAAGLQRALNP